MATIAELLGEVKNEEVQVGDIVRFSKTYVCIDDTRFGRMVRRCCQLIDCFHYEVSAVSHNVHLDDFITGKVVFIGETKGFDEDGKLRLTKKAFIQIIFEEDKRYDIRPFKYVPVLYSGLEKVIE